MDQQARKSLGIRLMTWHILFLHKGRLSPVFDGRERGEYDKTADSAHTNHELRLDTRKRPLEV